MKHRETAPSRFRVGSKIGRLTLRQRVRKGPRTSHNIRLQWLVDCDCGQRATIPEYYMRRSQNPKTDCGQCPDLYADKGITVAHAETYRTWKNIHMRCYDKTHRGYPRYGGRGVQVHPDWMPDRKDGFKKFLAHVGPRPTDYHSIDRIDSDGHYEPNNVKWSTLEEQAANKSKALRAKEPTWPIMTQNPQTQETSNGLEPTESTSKQDEFTIPQE